MQFPVPRSRPVEASQHQIVVAGGGLSGICAAISAARNGAEVALVHDRPMLGGHSSSEVRLVPEFNNWFTPWAKETGIVEELYAQDRRRNHEPWVEGAVNVIWDLVLYESVTAEENITLYLNTYVLEASLGSDGAIASIRATQWGSETDFNLSGDVFVDATGTGTLGHLAGADFRWGREGKREHGEPLQPDEPDDRTMGSTMYYRARNVMRPVGFEPPGWAARYERDEDLGATRTHMWIDVGHYWQEVGYPHHVVYDNEHIRREQLRHVLGVWDHVKNRGEHKADHYALEWVNWVPYRRENRRILGDYILTQPDIQQAPEFEDRVAFGAWPIDIHRIGGILQAPEPTLELDLLSEGVKPYSIPLRALYSRNVPNLFVAGRPISCSWIAFASTRILPTGAMTGQAVGAAAALSIREGIRPRELSGRHIHDLQQMLLKQDHFILNVRNQDAADLALGATAASSSQAVLQFPDPNSKELIEEVTAQLFPVSADRIDRIQLLVEHNSPHSVPLKVGLRAAAAVWDLESDEDIATAEVDLPARHKGWITVELGARVEPMRLYYIYVLPANGLRWSSYQETVEKRDIYYALMSAPYEGWWETLRDLPHVPSAVPVGTTAARRISGVESFGGRRWTHLLMTPGRLASRSYCIQVDPPSRPYGPSNATNGVARPEAWTNIWVSDPNEELPQWLEISFGQDREFNSVYLTFDTDLNNFPEFPLYVSPECAKDYELSFWEGSGWEQILRVESNYQRRRIHRFDLTRSSKLRLIIHATNGAPSARVYEVRVYNE